MVTGSQDQHRAIRLKVVEHMRDIGPLMMKHVNNCSSYSKCRSIDEYIDRSKMDQDGTWGSDIELLCFAHLCKTCVLSYSKVMGNWDRYGPHNVDRTITVHVCDKSIYLFHPAGHYDLVGSTVKVPKNICNDGTKSYAHKVKHENVTNGEDWVSVSHIQVWHDLRFHSGS